MSKFDIRTQVPKEMRDQGDTIHSGYFTIDTVDLDSFYDWYRHNPLIVTYACDQNEVVGYHNIIPLTTECGKLFDQNAIKEEDLDIQHILPIKSMHHAQYAYLASIAVKDLRSFRSRQCVAAIIAAIADNLLNGFDLKHFKRLYANPTTFNGNLLVRRMGMKPIIPTIKKPLNSNDIYAADVSPEFIANLQYLSQRYQRFVKNNFWLIQNKDSTTPHAKGNIDV